MFNTQSKWINYYSQFLVGSLTNPMLRITAYCPMGRNDTSGSGPGRGVKGVFARVVRAPPALFAHATMYCTDGRK